MLAQFPASAISGSHPHGFVHPGANRPYQRKAAGTREFPLIPRPDGQAAGGRSSPSAGGNRTGPQAAARAGRGDGPVLDVRRNRSPGLGNLQRLRDRVRQRVRAADARSDNKPRLDARLPPCSWLVSITGTCSGRSSVLPCPHATRRGSHSSGSPISRHTSANGWNTAGASSTIAEYLPIEKGGSSART